MKLQQNACDGEVAPENPEADHIARLAEERIPLSELAIGTTAEITAVSIVGRGRKKLADVGLIPGAKIEMEATAPFGSLVRINLLGTSIAISIEDAAGLLVRKLNSEEDAQ